MNRSILTATLFALFTMTACAGTTGLGTPAGGGGPAGPVAGASASTASSRAEYERISPRAELKEVPHFERGNAGRSPCPMPRS